MPLMLSSLSDVVICSKWCRACSLLYSEIFLVNFVGKFISNLQFKGLTLFFVKITSDLPSFFSPMLTVWR